MDFALWDLPSIITTMWKFEWNCNDNDEIAMRMINVDLLGWFWVRKSHLYMLKLFWKSLVSFRQFLDTFFLLLKLKRTLRHSWWVEFRLVHLDTWSYYVFDEMFVISISFVYFVVYLSVELLLINCFLDLLCFYQTWFWSFYFFYFRLLF